MDCSARLLADIGGTNARFAWQSGPHVPVTDVKVLACADHDTLADAVFAYLNAMGRSMPPA